ncbi:MAG TPA: hypothetical protein VFU49_17465 [Ktedonobacteraceae bacterium]|nr:hypothetical protein [Ktedonobacteraceae bacterium]
MKMHQGVPTSDKDIMQSWWHQLRPKLTLLYILLAIILLLISATGQMRLLNEVGKVFGGFFWAIDTSGDIIVVSVPMQLPPFKVKADSLTSSSHIIAVNTLPGRAGIQQAYRQAHDGDPITYTIAENNTTTVYMRPAAIFTWDMWWQNYGLTLLAGVGWLIVGCFLLITATDWSGAVEGMTLLPPAILLLLSSSWGNVQQPYATNMAIQLIWIPSFALLGAAFIHLSLTYRPEALTSVRQPRLRIDALPYLPLIALLAYEWSSYLIVGYVPIRTNIIFSLSYAAIGSMISFCIGIASLIRIGRLLPSRLFGSYGRFSDPIPLRISRRVGDLLTLWIGGVGIGFCLGVLPILLIGQTLLPLPMFYLLVAVYPFMLLYAIRSLRLIDRLHITLEQREAALQEQQRTASELHQTNVELRQATSLLLHADAHLRSLLSQRIHDQPKQQALRIRSLLGYWQHKLQAAAQHDPDGKVAAPPVIEALEKVRKVSEELEGDLRGLQLLVEDAYQRRSLGLKLHLQKLLCEDLPALHPESPLQLQVDLWALDEISPNLEQTEEGTKIAEAISYTITQALLNIYNHANTNHATIRTTCSNDALEAYITDDGNGFDPDKIAPEKTSLLKARLKVREANGTLEIRTIAHPQPDHGTTVTLRIPLPLAIKDASNIQAVKSGNQQV